MAGDAPNPESMNNPGFYPTVAALDNDKCIVKYCVERRANLRDRRGTLIVIKKEAAEEVGPAFESARKAQDKVISSYSERDLKLLSEFFSKKKSILIPDRQIV